MKKGMKFIERGLLLTGVLLILNSTIITLTGNVIRGNVAEGSSLIGLILIVGGLIIFLSRKAGELERRVAVYDASKGKRKSEEDYCMTDPQLYFTKSGQINLKEFKTREEVKEILKDSELTQIVQEAYGPKLLEIYHKGKPEEKEIAYKFLEKLYLGEIPGEKKKRSLSKEEKREIRIPFDSGWNIEPNEKQRKMLKKYNLGFKKGKNHPMIYSIKNPNLRITVSSTPSDVNSGKAIARDLIKLIEKINRKNK